ncbi:retrotransposon protein, putative, ty3-gypsy subclass [Tanacetum coccineum]
MDNTNSPPNVPPSFLAKKVLKLNSILESLNLIPSTPYSRIVCRKENDSDAMLIELIKNDDDLSEEEFDENDDANGKEELEGSDRHENSSQEAWNDQDQQVRGQNYGRSYGSSSQSGYLDYNSCPPCNLCGKFHPGKACHRATGACFECGEVGHLAKDCKKGSMSSGGKRFGMFLFKFRH